MSIDEKAMVSFSSDPSESEVRSMVYQGSLSMQYLLFKHAHSQLPRLNRLQNLIDRIENELFSPETLESLNSGQLLKLYGIASNQIAESIKFLERLHSMIQETGEVVKVTKSLSYEVETTNPKLDSVSRQVKGSDKLRTIKDILLDNILEASEKVSESS